MAKKTEVKENKVSRKRKLTGIVVSNKTDKTIVVKVTTKKRHPIYGKVVKTWKKYMADTAGKSFEVGQAVTIEECKPISKLKTWKVTKLEKTV